MGVIACSVSAYTISDNACAEESGYVRLIGQQLRCPHREEMVYEIPNLYGFIKGPWIR